MNVGMCLEPAFHAVTNGVGSVSEMVIEQERERWLFSLAERLARAWQNRDCIDGLSDQEHPRSRSEAFLVQDRMIQHIGDRGTGWKIGATSAKMRELDGHDDIIPGRLLARDTFADVEVIEINSRQFPGARMEAEFAFRLLEDLPDVAAPYVTDDIIDKVEMLPAIEIIGDRYPKAMDAAGNRAFKPDTLLAIADNGGGYGFVAGVPAVTWREIDFKQHPVSLTTDGGAPSESFLGEMRCNPLDALVDHINKLALRGIGLEAGEFVTTGAAAVPIPMIAGTNVVADYGAFGRIQLAIR